MNTFKHLRNVLELQIKMMNNSRSLFVEHPEVDFTRDRKLTFDKTVKSLLSLEAGALKDELLKIHDYALDTPTASAYIQARDKIKVDAFQHLFNEFNNRTHKNKLYKGYRLLAVLKYHQGSRSKASIYSLIETAKINHLKPYDYFEYLLTALTEININDDKELEKIMP